MDILKLVASGVLFIKYMKSRIVFVISQKDILDTRFILIMNLKICCEKSYVHLMYFTQNAVSPGKNRL
eukprot:snap_masked-scaffold_7-processed-gene-19.47-mRNA-1 protein AED:1.00 eAED:1.00 QI:0/0/0/0/1/1/2/0/67